MMKAILTRGRDLIITSVVFGSVTYGYLYYTAKKNEKQYLQAIRSDTLIDASRLSNQSFGISWGFQADDTIMSRIDSGDLLFMKFQCQECISVESMVKCYKAGAFSLEQEFHSVGCAFRDQSGLYIMFNQFGQTKVKGYCELVSLPYIRALTLQKRGKDANRVHLNLRKQVDIDKTINQSDIAFLQRVDRLLGGEGHVEKVQDLLSGQQQINIRTQTNNTLRSL